MSSASNIARRLFWQQLATGVISATTGEEHVVVQLEDMPQLSADDFFTLVPRVVVGIRFEVRDWRLVAVREGVRETVQIGAWLPAESWLLNQFDGLRTLHLIALDAAEKYGWSDVVARDFVREFFTRLALLQVVVPVNFAPSQN